MAHNFLMTEWARDNQEIWQRVVAKHGGHPEAFQWGTWDFFDWAIGKAWYTIGSVSKARKFGWTRYDDTYDTWVETFRSFENVGILPFPTAWATNEIPKAVGLLPHPGDLVTSRLAEKTPKHSKLQNSVEKTVPEMNGDLKVENI